MSSPHDGQEAGPSRSNRSPDISLGPQPRIVGGLVFVPVIERGVPSVHVGQVLYVGATHTVVDLVGRPSYFRNAYDNSIVFSTEAELKAWLKRQGRNSHWIRMLRRGVKEGKARRERFVKQFYDPLTNLPEDAIFPEPPPPTPSPISDPPATPPTPGEIPGDGSDAHRDASEDSSGGHARDASGQRAEVQVDPPEPDVGIPDLDEVESIADAERTKSRLAEVGVHELPTDLVTMQFLFNEKRMLEAFLSTALEKAARQVLQDQIPVAHFGSVARKEFNGFARQFQLPPGPQTLYPNRESFKEALEAGRKGDYDKKHCNLCDETYPTTFARHFTQNHDAGHEIPKCVVYGKVYKYMTDLRLHIPSHANTANPLPLPRILEPKMGRRKDVFSRENERLLANFSKRVVGNEGDHHREDPPQRPTKRSREELLERSTTKGKNKTPGRCNKPTIKLPQVADTMVGPQGPRVRPTVPPSAPRTGRHPPQNKQASESLERSVGLGRPRRPVPRLPKSDSENEDAAGTLPRAVTPRSRTETATRPDTENDFDETLPTTIEGFTSGLRANLRSTPRSSQQRSPSPLESDEERWLGENEANEAAKAGAEFVRKLLGGKK